MKSIFNEVDFKAPRNYPAVIGFLAKLPMQGFSTALGLKRVCK